ncbi:hypothetical protein B0H14DRAFT_2649960 [Mycena olivaceomarginata]|nr:hypothetical protein B0H14DRAFT_2649960 [Mycena olivaceomarginata]
MGHLDLEEDERVPGLKPSLTRVGNLLGKAVLEAPESHKFNVQEIQIAGFLLHNLWVQYYGILDLHRILDTERKVHLVAKDYRQRRKATNQAREITMRQRRCPERIASECHTERKKKKLGLETSHTDNHKRDGRVASGSARSGVAMVRTHAMELVARYGARMRGSIWAGLTKRIRSHTGTWKHELDANEREAASVPGIISRGPYMESNFSIGCSKWTRALKFEHRYLPIPSNVDEDTLRIAMDNGGQLPTAPTVNEILHTYYQWSNKVWSTFQRECKAMMIIFIPVNPPLAARHKALVIVRGPHNHPAHPKTKPSTSDQNLLGQAITAAGSLGLTNLLAPLTNLIYGGEHVSSSSPAYINSRKVVDFINEKKKKDHPQGMGCAAQCKVWRMQKSAVRTDQLTSFESLKAERTAGTEENKASLQREKIFQSEIKSLQDDMKLDSHRSDLREQINTLRREIEEEKDARRALEVASDRN